MGRVRKAEWREQERLIPGPMELARSGEEGRGWYVDAARQIRRYALEIGQCPRVVAGVMAITSPRVHVVRNIRITKTYFETGLIVGHFGKTQGLVDRFVADGTISGPKVSAFYEALRGDRDAVVVDVWVARAFNVGHDDDLGNRRGLTKKEYKRVDQAVRSLAGRLGWQPAETQAAIWWGSCLAHGRNPDLVAF